MKKLALATGCLLLAFSLTPAARGAPAALTNEDVLVLVEAGLPAPVIVAKIKASRTDFNTSEGQLAKLAQAGANANVLETMIQAGSVAKHREHLDWQAVQCNDETSVQGYLDTYPDGHYKPAAKNCLAAVAAERKAERLDWQAVQCDNAASVRGYLDAYPGGQYEPEAKACLTAIDAQRKPGEAFRDCPQCPELVVLPAGTFMMGSLTFEKGQYDYDDAGPRHRVTIAKPFAVGKYEVTFAEWDACRRTGGCSYNPDDEEWGRDNSPVINVSWRDAQEYVAWLSKETGESYRLLSESEWEYAARAGTTTPFHFGDTISADQANYNSNYIYGSGRKGVFWKRTIAVGSFPANNFGLHDMHGNVWEWVEDCWHGSYTGAPVDGSARTRGDDCFRVLRGGSWYNDPRNLRSANRDRDTAENRFIYVGFRVARTLTP